MTVKALYQQITGDTATHQRTISAALARESSRRRRAVALRVAGASLREIGARLRPPCSFGAADDLITRTMVQIWKQAQDLPRYYLSGRGGRPTDEQTLGYIDVIQRGRPESVGKPARSAPARRRR